MTNAVLVEISRLALAPDDTLIIKITSDEIGHEDILDLKGHVQAAFPENKIILWVIPPGSEMEVSIIAKEQN